MEICCRTDGRTYAVNLHVETMFPEDMYQGFIVGGTGEQSSADDDDNLSQEKVYSNEEEDETEDEVELPEESLDVRTHLQNRRDLIRRTTLSSDDHPYHGHPPTGFQRFILPFKDFALTSRGRLRLNQRDLDGAVNIDAIGFTLMDGIDGNFCFDLVSLRAVNILQGEVVGNLEDTLKEEEFEKRILSSREPKKKKKDDDEDSDTATEKTDSK